MYPTCTRQTIAPLQLPLPGLSGLWAPGGVELWNAFLGAVQREGASLDGVAIHAYPNSHSTHHAGVCHDGDWLETGCAQAALQSAYKFFQGTDGSPSRNAYPQLTRNKPIWLTETGVLAPPGAWVGGQPLSLARVSSSYQTPMINWFNAHIKAEGDLSYINAVAWFVTYSPDTPYTNLLAGPGSSTLTAVGNTWQEASCPLCECPGPDCP